MGQGRGTPQSICKRAALLTGHSLYKVQRSLLAGNRAGAQAVAHELTRRQLAEANRTMMEALQKLKTVCAGNLDNTSKS